MSTDACLLHLYCRFFSLNSFEHIPVGFRVHLALQQSDSFCDLKGQLIAPLLLLQRIPRVRKVVDKKRIIACVLILEEEQLPSEVAILLGFLDVRLQMTFYQMDQLFK